MIATSQNDQAAESSSERRGVLPSSSGFDRFCGLFHVPGMLLSVGVPLMVPVPQVATPGLGGRLA